MKNKNSYLLTYYRTLRTLTSRRLSALVALACLGTVFESIGIAMFLPLMTAFGSNSSASSNQDSFYTAQVFLQKIGLKFTLGGILLLIVFFFLLKSLAELYRESFLLRLRVDIIDELRNRMFRSFFRVDYLYYTSKDSGHFLNLTTVGVPRVSDAFYLYAQVISQIVIISTFLISSFILNWRFTVLALFLGVFASFSMRNLSHLARGHSREDSYIQTKLAGIILQGLQGFKYLVATHRFDRLETKLHAVGQDLKKLHYRLGFLGALSKSISEPITVLMLTALIYIQVALLKQNIAAILVSLVVFNRCARSILSFQNLWQSFSSIMGSIDYVAEEFSALSKHQESHVPGRIARFTHEIEFKQVSFAYGENSVFQNINLKFRKNATTAVVGPSGVGKSTIVDLVTGILKPTNGSILIDGDDLNSVDQHEWRSKVGYVTQEGIMFDDTIANNVSLWSAEKEGLTRNQVREAVEHAYASEFVNKLPKGLDSPMGNNGSKLSGGQKQRLAIARELFKCPELLILDEATSALDPISEKSLKQSIDLLKGKSTIILITHRIQTTKDVDYIYVLDKEGLVEQGTYSTLMEDHSSRFYAMNHAVHGLTPPG